MKRFAAISMVVVVALIAVGCSSSDGGSTTTTSPATPGSAGDTTTTSGTASDTTTTTLTATGSGAGGGLEQCMVGTWELDADSFFEIVTESLADEPDSGEFVHVGGVNQITASADGSFVDERIDWTFVVMTDFGNLEMKVNHTQVGTWSIDDGVITTSIEPGTTPEFEMSIDGLPFEIPGGAVPIDPPGTSIDSSAVVCTDSTLTLTVDGFVSTWNRTG